MKFCRLIGLTVIAVASLSSLAPAQAQTAKPNIVIIWGDDIGQSNISAYSHGLMGYKTPNIDRIAKEGVMFTDYYAEQSCTAGRASFITGQSGLRTGSPRSACQVRRSACRRKTRRLQNCSSRSAMRPANSARTILGDRNEFLPTVHGFDEFYGNLYHLNAEEEPELPDYPKDPAFRAKYGPRGVMDCKASTRTTRPSIRASVRSASRSAPTPAR